MGALLSLGMVAKPFIEHCLSVQYSAPYFGFWYVEFVQSGFANSQELRRLFSRKQVFPLR